MDGGIARLELETTLLARYVNMATTGDDDAERLDRSAYILLTRIAAEGPMSIAQLRSAFRLDASTLNRQTAAMLRARLVERIADPDGGLARKFAITDHGAVRLAADRERNVRGLARVLADWDPEEIEAFAASMDRFNRDIETLDGRPWPRAGHEVLGS